MIFFQHFHMLGGATDDHYMERALSNIANQRFFRFSLVGGSVMLLGLGVMYVLVDLLDMNKNLAYLIQTLITVEANFFLNAAITWRDCTNNRLWYSWLRFHGLKLATMFGSQFLFAGLLLLIRWMLPLQLGFFREIDYIIAYLGCVGIIMVINFLGSDKWVFKTKSKESGC